MGKSKTESIRFTRSKGRDVKVDFTGGDITSDAGLLAIREVDAQLKLTEQAAHLLNDPRVKERSDHDITSMLRQRVYGVNAGWEDLNDAEHLRHDLLYQLMAATDRPLASPSTLCRMENRQDREVACKLNGLFVESFIESHDKAPAKVILDFDATDIPVYGRQEKHFYHGYYNCHCFLPLYVFCGERLLVAYLRPSNQDAAKHSSAILKLLVERLRKAWPRTKIVFRADSGFCRKLTMSYCDTHDVKYIIGIGRNHRLLEPVSELVKQAHEQFELSESKQRLFDDFDYKAKSWRLSRRVICKAEHTAKGPNTRFIVTNIAGDPQKLYDQRYCARGEMENRIKEQLMLFADRTSAHRWWTNQWRMLLSALAYILTEALRRLYLQGTVLARAQCNTIRTKLIKIGAVIVRKATVIHLHLSSAHPMRELFYRLFAQAPP